MILYVYIIMEWMSGKNSILQLIFLGIYIYIYVYIDAHFTPTLCDSLLILLKCLLVKVRVLLNFIMSFWFNIIIFYDFQNGFWMVSSLSHLILLHQKPVITREWWVMIDIRAWLVFFIYIILQCSVVINTVYQFSLKCNFRNILNILTVIN